MKQEEPVQRPLLPDIEIQEIIMKETDFRKQAELLRDLRNGPAQKMLLEI